VTTASPVKLVAMLYDGAIRNLGQAVLHLRNRNLAGKRDAVDKALAIVHQLHGSLDMEKGGEIAVELDRLYAYVISRILEGSAKLDPRPLEEAARLLTTLNSAWEEVAAAEGKQPAGNPRPPERTLNPQTPAGPAGHFKAIRA
jgi:flagellar protein FliS